MIKLRTLVAAALFSFTVVGSLTAAAAPIQHGDGLNASQPVTGTCYIYMGGRWWAVPC